MGQGESSEYSAVPTRISRQGGAALAAAGEGLSKGSQWGDALVRLKQLDPNAPASIFADGKVGSELFNEFSVNSTLGSSKIDFNKDDAAGRDASILSRAWARYFAQRLQAAGQKKWGDNFPGKFDKNNADNVRSLVKEIGFDPSHKKTILAYDRFYKYRGEQEKKGKQEARELDRDFVPLNLQRSPYLFVTEVLLPNLKADPALVSWLGPDPVAYPPSGPEDKSPSVAAPAVSPPAPGPSAANAAATAAAAAAVAAAAAADADAKRAADAAAAAQRKLEDDKRAEAQRQEQVRAAEEQKRRAEQQRLADERKRDEAVKKAAETQRLAAEAAKNAQARTEGELRARLAEMEQQAKKLADLKTAAELRQRDEAFKAQQAQAELERRRTELETLFNNLKQSSAQQYQALKEATDKERQKYQEGLQESLQYQSRLDALNTQQTRLQAEITRLNGELQAAKRNEEQAKRDIAATAAAASSDASASVQQRLADQAAQLASLQREKSALSQQLSTAQQALAKVEQSLITANANLDASTKQAMTCERNIASLRAQLASMPKEADMVNLRATLASLRAELDACRARSSSSFPVSSSSSSTVAAPAVPATLAGRKGKKPPMFQPSNPADPLSQKECNTELGAVYQSSTDPNSYYQQVTSRSGKVRTVKCAPPAGATVKPSPAVGKLVLEAQLLGFDGVTTDTPKRALTVLIREQKASLRNLVKLNNPDWSKSDVNALSSAQLVRELTPEQVSGSARKVQQRLEAELRRAAVASAATTSADD